MTLQKCKENYNELCGCIFDVHFHLIDQLFCYKKKMVTKTCVVNKNTYLTKKNDKVNETKVIQNCLHTLDCEGLLKYFYFFCKIHNHIVVQCTKRWRQYHGIKKKK